MGVHGLWKLIEPSGKVVPLDTLEGKVLAIDISIWLHQAVKGYQDSKGAPIPNAHLLTLYNRVCKLLYFRIKPVFVFDGGVPALKKETIAKRMQLKTKNQSETVKIQKQLINTLLKHTAVTKVLSEKTKAELGSQTRKISNAKNDEDDDLFILPPSQTIYESSDSESYDDTSGCSDSSPTKYFNIHDVDEKSVQFKNLPADVRHEILMDLKETRKQNSWGRIHELPKQSDDFSSYQMKRLLKRYSIQTCLEDAEKEMGGASLSLAELESLLNDHGVITENKGKRIASDENTRYLYIKDVKKALEATKSKEVKEKDELQAKKAATDTVKNITTILENDTKDLLMNENNQEEKTYERDLQAAIQLSLQQKESTSTLVHNKEASLNQLSPKRLGTEFQEDLEAAIKLSLQDAPSISLTGVNANTSQEEVSMPSDELSSSDTTPMSSQDILNPDAELSTYLRTLNDSDFISSDDDNPHDESIEEGQKAADKIFSAARNYMMEYGGLTQAGIAEIFGENQKKGTSVDFEVQSGSQDCNSKRNPVTSVINNPVEVASCNETAIEIMSNSETSSDGEFVDVASDQENNQSGKKQQEPKSALEIVVDTKEDLVDDIFSDIFDSQSSALIQSADEVQAPNILTSAQPEFQPPKQNAKKLINIITEETDTQEAIIESIKEMPKQSEPTTSNLMQELMAEKPSSPTNGITVEALKKLKSTLNQASVGLMIERGTKERMATNISDQMYHEAQDLLRLFGIPYIIAPMEAEAQCAFLNEIQLTDGTITDDSDIWLFGGQTVYKNFFNHNKQVLEFKAQGIQHHFKLRRHQLISLAMLVGSDYTTGIQGIGPVTALEVLAAFPSKSNAEVIAALERFREWFTTGRRAVGRGKAVLRNKLKNIELHDGFPSSSVLRAYLEPTVETSRDPFVWGKPHVEALVAYTHEKFGWSEKKVTNTLDPVLRRLSDNASQRRIQDYFKTVYKAPLNKSMEIQQRLSKRVQKALGTMGELEEPVSSSDEDMQALQHARELTKRKSRAMRKQIDVQLEVLDKKRMENRKAAVKDGGEVKKPRLANLHRKEVIPQREFDKSNQLQTRLKAIEVFRKSKQGPGYVKKRAKVVRKPKQDAELSESSESD